MKSYHRLLICAAKFVPLCDYLDYVVHIGKIPQDLARQVISPTELHLSSYKYLHSYLPKDSVRNNELRKSIIETIVQATKTIVVLPEQETAETKKIYKLCLSDKFLYDFAEKMLKTL